MFECHVRATYEDGTPVLDKGDNILAPIGVSCYGSTVEIARANAYRQVCELLLVIIAAKP